MSRTVSFLNRTLRFLNPAIWAGMCAPPELAKGTNPE
jgi:hypothetical protein